MKRFSMGLWLVGGVAGAMVFWIVQSLTGLSTITQFMGQQIVSQGGYSPLMVLPLGWAIHLGVSLAYSLLFAILMLIPFMLTEHVRLFLGLVVAGALGWITTLITIPAITVTISLLSGKGFPAIIPELNRTFGPPFWAHMLFFGVVWLIYLLVPYLGRKY